MKYLSISFLLLACILVGHAQTSTSRVIYRAKHSFPESEQFSGKNTLHFNHHASLFVHNNYPTETSMTERGYTFIMKVGDPEGFCVYTNLKDSLVYGKVKGMLGGKSLLTLKEPLDTIDWTITGEQKTISGYRCLSASARYEGRDYVAWFTPDIPAPFGPYRLQGLPGLILFAYSQDGKVRWEFTGYEAQTQEPYPLAVPSNGDIITWPELVKARINWKYKKESKNTDTSYITISDGNPEFLIEKEKFHIFKKYLYGQ